MTYPIFMKRIYEQPGDNDGYRVLIDRLWPRGIAKEAVKLDEWCKEIAPPDEMRKAFGHDPAHWEQFYREYSNLLKQPEYQKHILELAKIAVNQPLTLLFAAKDTEHNNAVIVREMILTSLK